MPRIIASIGPYSATVAPIPTKPARPIHNCSWPRVGSGIPGTHSDPQERRCPSPSLSKSSCVDLGSKSQATGEGPSGVSGRGVSESRPARSTGSCWVGLQKRGGIGDGTPSWTARRGSDSSFLGRVEIGTARLVGTGGTGRACVSAWTPGPAALGRLNRRTGGRSLGLASSSLDKAHQGQVRLRLGSRLPQLAGTRRQTSAIRTLPPAPVN